MGGTVQIDESLFHGKHKYNRGRLLLGNRNNNNDSNGDSSTKSSDDSDSSIDQIQAINYRNDGNRVDGKTSIAINRNPRLFQFI